MGLGIGLGRAMPGLNRHLDLAGGDREAAAVLVAVNSLFQIVAFAALGYFSLRVAPRWLHLQTVGPHCSFGRIGETVAVGVFGVTSGQALAGAVGPSSRSPSSSAWSTSGAPPLLPDIGAGLTAPATDGLNVGGGRRFSRRRRVPWRRARGPSRWATQRRHAWLPTVAVAVEVAVLRLDERSPIALGRERRMPRSMMWPPTRGSKSISARGSTSRCLSGSHHAPISRVKPSSRRRTGRGFSSLVAGGQRHAHRAMSSSR